MYINGDSYVANDYYNSFTNNKFGRWYNEFKKFREQYYSSDDTGCVDYNSFTNLHRMYVFDISKQSETMTKGIANVRLEFQLNSPTPVDYETTAYCVSFFDRIWSLKSDGTKQYILK